MSNVLESAKEYISLLFWPYLAYIAFIVSKEESGVYKYVSIAFGAIGTLLLYFAVMTCVYELFIYTAVAIASYVVLGGIFFITLFFELITGDREEELIEDN